MKRHTILTGILILSALIFSACAKGGAAESGSSKLDIKIDGQDSTLQVKSGGVYYGNIINTAPGKPPLQTFSHSIYLANYEMDTTSAATMKKGMNAPEQIRLLIALRGEEGTNTDSPFKVGTYSVKTDKVSKVGILSVTTFTDGKEKSASFDTQSLNPKAQGEVKITSVTDDSVSGEINVTEGDKTIKGTFTAKLPKK